MSLVAKMADDEFQSVAEFLSSETAKVGMEVHPFKVRVLHE